MDIHQSVDKFKQIVYFIFIDKVTKNAVGYKKASYKKNALARALKTPSPKPRFELSDKQLGVLKTTSHVILGTIAVAGIITLSAALPGILSATGQIYLANQRYKKASRRERLKQQQSKAQKAFYYLKAKGYIELIPTTDNDFIIKIKQKGRRLIKKLNFQNLQISIKEKWDGRWWLVLADVPVKQRKLADMFRGKLKSMKFYPLQRTVWLYPHDPRDEIDFVSAYYDIDEFVTTMRIDHLDPADLEILERYFKEQKII